MVNDERWTMKGGKETRVSIRTWSTHSTVYPFSRLWHAWLWKVAPVRQSCRPGDLLRAAWNRGGIQKYASTLRSSGYHARLRATVTEFTSLRSHPSLRPRVRCASRSWVALPPNKLSPPHHLHKSIKSVLVEFEASRPPELVISRYETRIGAGENVRQMFARSEARSFVSVLVEGSFVSFISFFGGERGYLFSFFVVFALYIIVYI